MSDFSATVAEFWHAAFAGRQTFAGDDGFTIAIAPELSEDRRVMILELSEGPAMATLTPALADRLDLHRRPPSSVAAFRCALRNADVMLHGADYLFYLPQTARPGLLEQSPGDDVRRLTLDDAALFSEFESDASEQDLDDAYVALDHWRVFGAFERGRLVGAASMYPWQSARIADLGVLTLPPFRGRGHARKLVRAMCRHACELQYEPQYRCQLDNPSSVALAKAAGLALFGTWQTVSPDSPA
ncbi:GNAT family N-acetyltransferase [Lysobacter sp. CA199]|uniref:GNAT family N-acetyltransferase n=1 Tax=Lysobacter sp. CA199 TaxID=3455608 RepID=UPI003F8D2A94